jgi:hypothetical protein
MNAEANNTQKEAQPTQWIERDWELPLTVDHVLRGQGADPERLRQRRPALVEIAEWALREGLPLLRPVVLSQEFQVQGVRHEDLILSAQIRLKSALLTQHLAGARSVMVTVCTVGPQLEAITSEMMSTDPVQALALEGVGTAAVEMLATQAANRWEKHCHAAGLSASIPLSPGMVGWPVEVGQRQIFSLLDTTAIGVRLTESSMMVPRMSLSQLLGFGEGKMLQGRTCDYCNLKETCRYQDHYQPALNAQPPLSKT